MIISARYWLFGANTPKNRVKLTLAEGTRAANFEMKSSGPNITCVSALPNRWINVTAPVLAVFLLNPDFLIYLFANQPKVMSKALSIIHRIIHKRQS
jgi:hypothetical protein